MGWAATPVRQSAMARLHSKMLHGFCKEGVLMIVTMTARLLKNAKMAEDPLTAASRMLFMKAAVSFLCVSIQLGSPQKIISLEAISSSVDLLNSFSIDWIILSILLALSESDAGGKLVFKCKSFSWKWLYYMHEDFFLCKANSYEV